MILLSVLPYVLKFMDKVRTEKRGWQHCELDGGSTNIPSSSSFKPRLRIRVEKDLVKKPGREKERERERERENERERGRVRERVQERERERTSTFIGEKFEGLCCCCCCCCCRRYFTVVVLFSNRKLSLFLLLLV